MAECGLLVGGVLLILGVALGFTNYLVDARIPERAVDWVTAAIDSRWLFLIALNLFLLLAGCLLDIFSATVVLVRSSCRSGSRSASTRFTWASFSW